jgi:hypothetical protein
VFAEATRQGVLIDRGVGTNRVRRAPIAVDVTGIGAAERALNNLARNRAAAIRVTVTTGVRVAGFTGQGGTTFQHGTDFAPGGVALVGEAGPELVEIPRGSRVHDASMTKAILTNPASFVGAGGGGALGNSRLIAALAAEDRALLRAVVGRPIQTTVKLDQWEFAKASSSNERWRESH